MNPICDATECYLSALRR